MAISAPMTLVFKILQRLWDLTLAGIGSRALHMFRRLWIFQEIQSARSKTKQVNSQLPTPKPAKQLTDCP